MNKKHGPWYDAEISWSRNRDGYLEMSTDQVTIVLPDEVAIRLANWILGTGGAVQ